MDRTHSILSPSGAHRWLHCTPSAVLEDKLPESTSTYADEGTLAHAYCQIQVELLAGKISYAKYKITEQEIHAHKLYKDEMKSLSYAYACFVMEKFNTIKADHGSAFIFLEIKVSIESWVPNGKGHIDTVIIGGDTLIIIDYKHGQGVRVDAEDNEQLSLYALGAIEKFKVLYDLYQVQMFIYQPRIENFSKWEISVDKLLFWGNGFVKPRARLAHAGVGEFNPGDHCKFCKAKPTCKALKNWVTDKMDALNYKLPELLTHEETADVLKVASIIVDYIGSIEKHALEQALNNGVKYPGFKVVQGKSNRKIPDENIPEVEKALLDSGYEKKEITVTKLKGITELEKLTGKLRFNQLLGDWVVKPSGAPTLVEASDKRPEWSRAADAFKGIEFENE